MNTCSPIGDFSADINCSEKFYTPETLKVEIHPDRKCYDELGNYLGKISDTENGFIIRGRNKPTIKLITK